MVPVGGQRSRSSMLLLSGLRNPPLSQLLAWAGLFGPETWHPGRYQLARTGRPGVDQVSPALAQAGQRAGVLSGPTRQYRRFDQTVKRLGQGGWGFQRITLSLGNGVTSNVRSRKAPPTSPSSGPGTNGTRPGLAAAGWSGSR